MGIADSSSFNENEPHWILRHSSRDGGKHRVAERQGESRQGKANLLLGDDGKTREERWMVTNGLLAVISCFQVNCGRHSALPQNVLQKTKGLDTDAPHSTSNTWPSLEAGCESPSSGTYYPCTASSVVDSQTSCAWGRLPGDVTPQSLGQVGGKTEMKMSPLALPR